ncbi:MAG: sugar ABC transporter permease, partial [Gammaproteobacteria bacterium]
FYLLPIGYAVRQSLMVIKRDGTYGVPKDVFGGFSQYALVFQDHNFMSSMGRMFLFGVVQVPIMLGLALLFALLLDSPLLRGKKFFRLAFFVPYAVPGVIAAIMWGNLFSPNLSPFKSATRNVDFLGSNLVLWALANVVTWVYVGYNMLIMYSSLMSIPTEIYEAARMDGAGQMRMAWSIKIPLVRPAIILTAVFSIIGTLQLLAEPQVFQSFSSAVTSTFTPNMSVYATASIPNSNLAAAMSVVLALITFVLSFSFLKFTQRQENRS